MIRLSFDQFLPFEHTQLSFYVAANILLAAGCLIALLYIYFCQRHLCLRPSILIAAFFNIFLQWPLAIYSGFFEYWLPRPWDLALAVHGCVVLPLLMAFILPDDRLKACWAGLGAPAGNQKAVNLGIAILGCMAAVVLGIYYAYVPFNCTGFYGYAFYPEAGPLLREYSLKLLDSRLAAYAYSFYTSFISGLLFLFLLVKAQYFADQRRYLSTLGCIAAMLGVALLGCMEGASYRYLTYGLLFVLFLLWNSHLMPKRRHIVWIAGVATLLFTLQMLISLSSNPAVTPERKATIAHLVDGCAERIPLKPVMTDARWQSELLGFTKTKTPAADIAGLEQQPGFDTMTAAIPIQPRTPEKFTHTAGEDSDGENGIADRLVEIWEKGRAQLPSMANRIFMVPFRVGSWYYHYAQTAGPTGIAGVPRLARLAGMEPIAIGNRMGLIYGPEYYGRDVAPAINASAGFIFNLYAYFGQAGIWLIFALIAMMDVFLILIVRLAPPLQTIFLAFITTICLNLMQSDIGYLMYSGGLLPAAAIMVFLHLTTKSAGDRESGNPGKPSL